MSVSVFAGDTRHRVAVLVRPGVLPLELGLVHQLLGAAERDGDPLYELVTCAPDTGPVPTNADFPIHVDHGPDTLAAAHTVVVPASHAAGGTDTTGALDSGLAGALAQIRPGTRVASICTGAFVLAAAGWLDGRRATTHWKSTDLFRRVFPGVRLDPDVLYTDEGDICTSAGEAAGIDLCLHLVRRDFGAAVANDVARSAVVPPHRDGGQAQFIARPVPGPGRHSATGGARAWALEHLELPLSLRDLAGYASMSVRTFTRRFREEVGVTPLHWLTQRRVERARQLLEETDIPVDEVAARAGFGTGASLRQHLRATIGVAPSAYRATFRGPPSVPSA